METILIAVLGTSPGILTETVWALAVDEVQPVVVDRVVVITTTEGRQKAVTELLTPDANYGGQTVWEALKSQLSARGLETTGKLVLGEAGIRVFPQAEDRGFLSDIRTAAENDLAADFLLHELRGLADAEDVRLIGSVAGGRKTMSTLLYAVFSLLGRPHDRLTHVLVNDPFESPGLSPRFYFPCTPPLLHQGRNREGQVVTEVRSGEARLKLADMPFVRLRRLFQRDFARLPARFTTLVESVNASLSPQPVALTWDDRSGRVSIGKAGFKAGGSEHPLMDYMVCRALAGKAPLKNREKAPEHLTKHLKEWKQRHQALEYRHRKASWWQGFTEDDLTKPLSRLRGKLNKLNGDDLGERALPSGGPVGLDLDQVTVSMAS